MTHESSAGLAQAVLDAEAERQERQDEADRDILFADELLPGVATEEMTLRQGVKIGGTFTFVMLILLQSVDELESAVLSVLAPDIRDTFGISDGVIVFVSAASGAFLVLGAMVMGFLADRYRRSTIIGCATAFFAAMVFTCGLGGERLHVVPVTVRGGGGEGERPAGAGLVDRRHVPDRRPGPGRRVHRGRGAARGCAEPRAGRWHRRTGGRYGGVAVVLLPARACRSSRWPSWPSGSPSHRGASTR